MICILDDQKEGARRRMVMSGAWTEEESSQKMREEETIRQKEKIPHFKEEYMTHRDYYQLKDMYS